MRYRRLSYRYVVVASRQPRPLSYAAEGQHAMGIAQLCWRPPADVFETPDHVVVTVELAGVDEEQLELMLFEDALILEGQRRLPRPAADATYHAAEIRQGALRLELPLPARIDPQRAQASYERGLLVMTLAKAGR